jgi:dsDNA-binding SOS-regulon protein
MAVITRYVVVRNGVELEQVFSVKKEAEAYDKMLDAAEQLAGFIKSSALEVSIADETIDAVAILLAKNGPEVVKILKGIKPIAPPSETEDSSGADQAPSSEKKKPSKPATARRRNK